MLLKPIDDKSADLAELQKLLTIPGVSPRVQMAIQKQIDDLRTGMQGEKDAAYFIDMAFYLSEGIAVIHDLRLKVDGYTVQIDHLLLNRLGHVCVLETKNLKANLTCSANGEWTAWYGKKPFAIASPVEQARRHVALLTRWFEQRKAPIKNIEPVVLVSPTSHVSQKTGAGIPVLRSDLFKRWYENERPTGSAIGLLWGLAARWSPEELRRVGQVLVDAHTPNHNWAAQFDWALPANSVTKPIAAPAPAVPKVTAKTMPIVPENIATSYGVIQVKPVSDGRLALRHAPDEKLQDFVRGCVRDKGRWQPRFRNWLVSSDDLPDIMSRLTAAAS